MKAATDDGFRALIAAVINHALADLEKTSPAMGAGDHVRDEAMAWINSPEREAFCYALDADYRTIREKAAALYRRFLEKAEGREKASRKSGAGAGKRNRCGSEPTTERCRYGNRPKQGIAD
jgi:hypothetical protein